MKSAAVYAVWQPFASIYCALCLILLFFFIVHNENDNNNMDSEQMHAECRHTTHTHIRRPHCRRYQFFAFGCCLCAVCTKVVRCDVLPMNQFMRLNWFIIEIIVYALWHGCRCDYISNAAAVASATAYCVVLVANIIVYD